MRVARDSKVAPTVNRAALGLANRESRRPGVGELASLALLVVAPSVAGHQYPLPVAQMAAAVARCAAACSSAARTLAFSTLSAC